MEIGLRHDLNTIKAVLGREPEEILKNMSSYDICMLATGIRSAAYDEVYKICGRTMQLRECCKTIDDAIEIISGDINEVYETRRDMKPLYTYLASYTYIHAHGTEEQLNNFVMYGNTKGEKNEQ